MEEYQKDRALVDAKPKKKKKLKKRKKKITKETYMSGVLEMIDEDPDNENVSNRDLFL